MKIMKRNRNFTISCYICHRKISIPIKLVGNLKETLNFSKMKVYHIENSDVYYYICKDECKERKKMKLHQLQLLSEISIEEYEKMRDREEEKDK